MKIDRTKSKIGGKSEVPLDCKLLIAKLKACNQDQLLDNLKKIKTWGCGKCELYHWIDILDMFDNILEECCKNENESQWALPVDAPENAKKRELLMAVIQFTALLIEHSFSRHLYNSIEHLITLLSSSDMTIVLAILNLLFVFSKRSNFFSRIPSERRQALLTRLNYLAENWGGKEHGFGLAECCQDLPLTAYPASSTTFKFEFYAQPDKTETEEKSDKPGGGNKKANSVVGVHIENVHLIDKPLAQIMKEIIESYQVPSRYHVQMFTHLRLAKNFANYTTRLQCVQARLNALSIIVYCQAIQEVNPLMLYNGLIEELVNVLELKNGNLIDIKSASLKALTSIIHLDRNSKMKSIIDSTGANSYHGFLPILVRGCINSLISGSNGANVDGMQYPLNFATALFSFLYHLASYEQGCEALVQCGIMESLLRIIDWKGPEIDHITFVTRAVRVIDLITNLDMNAFTTNNGLNIFVHRLEYEVDVCRKEQPHEIEVPADKLNREKHALEEAEASGEHHGDNAPSAQSVSPMEVEHDAAPAAAGSGAAAAAAVVELPLEEMQEPIIDMSLFVCTTVCYPQRAALLKSMLNFLKKAVQYSTLTEGIRHLMYGSFPRALRHIISNAEYYGPSLFLLATDVVSVYVYHEPSLLSTLQESGLTDVILYALLVKEVPATKEVLASLPNVFTALCLNHRGLASFIALQPFERLFKIFLSPVYLQSMRRRRSESVTDTATSLGIAMDELMRHQPSLKSRAVKAIIKLLKDICVLGSDPRYVCTKTSSKSGEPGSTGLITLETVGLNDRLPPAASNINNDSSSSEEDEDYDDDTTATTTTPPSNVTAVDPSIMATAAQEAAAMLAESNKQSTSAAPSRSNSSEQVVREQIPLIDYIQNVMRFVESILSNNSTEDHCQEFIQQNGLDPLFSILALPNLPLDFALTNSCTQVASVFKSILGLARENSIFVMGLERMNLFYEKLNPLVSNLSASSCEGSVLLEDLINHLANQQQQRKALGSLSSSKEPMMMVTQLQQAISALHSYVLVFANICRTSQFDMRTISIKNWGSPLGLSVIENLSKLFVSLVWESTLLLGTNEANIGQKNEAVRIQLDRLNSLVKGIASGAGTSAAGSSAAGSSAGGGSAVGGATSDSNLESSAPSPMEVDCTSNDSNDVVCSNCGVRSDPNDLQVIPLSTASGSSGSGGKRSKSQASKLPQNKYIKPLVRLTSLLGRTLSDLFSLLVKLCVGSPIRRRNHHNAAPQTASVPTAESRQIAIHLNLLLFNGLKFHGPFKSVTPKYRITFFVCSMNFATSMLFDDRKCPYHLMLQYFVLGGGQDAFFECFRKVFASVELQNELPEWLTEFLDSWLMLLEKMTNPTTLMDSQHLLPLTGTRGGIGFDPTQYLIRVHREAFYCIIQLWNEKFFRLNNDRFIDSVLTILSHLLRGESVIENYLKSQKDLPSTSGSSAAPISPRQSRFLAALASVAVTGGPSTSAAGSASAPGPAPPRAPITVSGPTSAAVVPAVSIPMADVAALAAAANAAPAVDDLPEEANVFITSLTDMGFTREMALEALLNVGPDVVAATDWLLNQPDRAQEDEQMLRALNMSLDEVRASAHAAGGEPAADAAPLSPPRASPGRGASTMANLRASLIRPSDQATAAAFAASVAALSAHSSSSAGDGAPTTPKASKKKEDKGKSKKKAEESKPTGPTPLVNEVPVPKAELDSFTDKILDGTLKLLDQLPEIVFKCCELLIAVSKRNGPQWFERMIAELISNVDSNIVNLLNVTRFMDTKNKTDNFFKEWTDRLCDPEHATKLFSRVHLLALLFDQMKEKCAIQMSKSELISHIIDMLEHTSFLLRKAQENKATTTTTDLQTPRWLAPLVILIDLYEKYSLASKRRQELLGQTKKRIWKYYDERAPNRWPSFAAANSKAIDEAFVRGDASYSFVLGRHRCVIKFNIMMQESDDSGNGRMVMFVNAEDEKKEEKKASTLAVTTTTNGKTTTGTNTEMSTTSTAADAVVKSEESEDVSPKLEVDQDTKIVPVKMEEEKPEPETLKMMSEQQSRSLIDAMVALVKLPIDAHTLHAVMRLVLRLTRDYSMACAFAELGGITSILSLTKTTQYVGFVSLATLIIRHVIEDEHVLRQTMEKILRTQSNLSAPFRRDIHYMFRLFNPAACRNLELFTQTAKSTLRITLDEVRGAYADSSVMYIRGLPAKTGVNEQSTAVSEVPKLTRDIVCELLNLLPHKRHIDNTSKSPVMSTVAPAAKASEGGQTTTTTTTTPSTESKPTGAANKSDDASKPTTNKAVPSTVFHATSILSLLSELTRSYSIIANVICEHNYPKGFTELITEDCSALSFILDNLINAHQTLDDKDCHFVARLLFSSLASVQTPPEVHQAIVVEIKAALARTVVMPETEIKHGQIQALSTLIWSVMEVCPHQYTRGSNGAHHRSSDLNNLVKLFIKKGVVMDLAKIIQSIDLSSPHTSSTVNSLLKTLESIAKITHLPAQSAFLSSTIGAVTGGGGLSTSTPLRDPDRSRISQPQVSEDNSGAAPTAAASQSTTPNVVPSTGAGVEGNNPGQDNQPANASTPSGANAVAAQQSGGEQQQPPLQVSDDAAANDGDVNVVEMRSDSIDNPQADVDNHLLVINNAEDFIEQLNDQFAQYDVDSVSFEYGGEEEPAGGHPRHYHHHHHHHHPHGNAFASDEMRTTDDDDDDDDEDEEMNEIRDMVAEANEVANRNDNAINPNIAESESSDDTASDEDDDDDEDVDDVEEEEEEEEEADNVGSVHDDPDDDDEDEDDDEDHLDEEEDEEFDDEDEYVNAFLDDNMRGAGPMFGGSQDVLMNIEDMLNISGGVFERSLRHSTPYLPAFTRAMGEELGLNLGNDQINSIANAANSAAALLLNTSPNVLVQHPLLSDNIDIAASAGQYHSFNARSFGSNAGGGNGTSFGMLAPMPVSVGRSLASNYVSRMRHRVRQESRPAVLNAGISGNWHFGGMSGRVPQDIIHRLFGSTYGADIMGFSTRPHHHLFTSDIPEDDIFDNSHSAGGRVFAGGSGNVNAPFYGNATGGNSYTALPSSGVGGGASTPYSVSAIPSTMNRWYEESRVLDGEYMYDAIFLVKSDIIKCLQKFKEAELKERKKKSEEAAAAEKEAAAKKQSRDMPSLTIVGSTAATTPTAPTTTTTATASAAADSMANLPVTTPTTAAAATTAAATAAPTTTTTTRTPRQAAPTATTASRRTSQRLQQQQRHYTQQSQIESLLATLSEGSSASRTPAENLAIISAASSTAAALAHATANLVQASNAVASAHPEAARQLASLSLDPEASRIMQGLADERSSYYFSGVPRNTPQQQVQQPQPQLVPVPAPAPVAPVEMIDVDMNANNAAAAQVAAPEAMEAEPRLIVIDPSPEDNPVPAQEEAPATGAAVVVDEPAPEVQPPEGGNAQAPAPTVSSEGAAPEATATTSAAATPAATAADPAAQQGSSSGTTRTYNLTPEERAILGDQEIPDGVDPSFLAALPDNIRQEVIAEQFRLQRLNNPPPSGGASGSSAAGPSGAAQQESFSEVSAEFLAALPPNIQEEVLAQQRAEQQRLAAANTAPDAPVDPNSFFSSLPAGLRRQVLSDLDDSQLRLLPESIANEARTLRQEYESRHRHLQERVFSTHALQRILRTTPGTRTRLMAGGHWQLGGNGLGIGRNPGRSNIHDPMIVSRPVKGKLLLDHDAVSSLLMLLFLHDNVISIQRLHRLFRSLCHHAPTRQWVVNSLLEILDKTRESMEGSSTGMKRIDSASSIQSLDLGAAPASGGNANSVPVKFVVHNPSISWLSITLDGAFGTKTNVFTLNRNPNAAPGTPASSSSSSKKGTASLGVSNIAISIHPNASSFVCRNVLDMLIFLGKCFPEQFIIDTSPSSLNASTQTSSSTTATSTATTPAKESDKEQPAAGTPTTPASTAGPSKSMPSFFSMLLRHDCIQTKKIKKHGASALNQSMEVDAIKPATGSANNSAFMQLISLLSHDFIIKNTSLTDRLIRLLMNISYAIVGDINPSQVNIPFLPIESQPIMPHKYLSPKAIEIQRVLAQKSQLKLLVDVLITRSCTEEGMNDATVMLNRLSITFPECRYIFYEQMLDGVRQLGQQVFEDINRLSQELKQFLSNQKRQAADDRAGPSTSSQDKNVKGCIQDRYNNTQIVVSAPTTAGKPSISGKEVQLPSMSALIAKSSSQHLFLRILKIIMQLREPTYKNRDLPNNRYVSLRGLSRRMGDYIFTSADGRRFRATTRPPVGLMGPPDTTMRQAIQRRVAATLGEGAIPAAERIAPAAATTAPGTAPTTSAPTDSTAAPNVAGAAAAAGGATTSTTSATGTTTTTTPICNPQIMPDEEKEKMMKRKLSQELHLDHLWDMLSECLCLLSETPDDHAVLVLQPAVEAFFLVHAPEKSKSSSSRNAPEPVSQQVSHIDQSIRMMIDPPSESNATAATDNTEAGGTSGTSKTDSQKEEKKEPVDPDVTKFLNFAETHRVVLNQILRQSNVHLSNGPFAVLVDHTRILDFDVKRRYFRQELERFDHGFRRDDLTVHVRRDQVFEDSFRELNRRASEEWKHRFYIVFEGEEGQDAGGLLREWYTIISREIFNPNYALFTVSPGDRVTYMINSSSHFNSNHLSYFKFVGRVIAKAVYDNKLLECYFTRSFYKHILGKKVKYTDMESEDYAFYQGLVYMLENNVNALGTEITFSLEIQEFGVTETRDLIADGRNRPVTEENKAEYVKLVCQEKMTGSIKKQLNSFLEGFYEIIPKRLISIFNEQELELLISGLPNIDIDDLKANTEYHKYQVNSLQIQWFWRALRSFDQADRAKFLQFVTGTSKVPLQGFSALEGMNGPQKFQIHLDDRSTDRLPSAHTCFNQMDLPAYETYDKLRLMLLKAFHECSEGFGFA